MLSEIANIRQVERFFYEEIYHGFNQQMEKNYVELLKVHKNVNSKRLLYLIFLNIFLLLSTGTAVYIAIKKSISKSYFKSLVQERSKLQNNLNNVEMFSKKIQKQKNSIKNGINQNNEIFFIQNHHYEIITNYFIP